MPLSADRIVFGIHSITPYNRSTGQQYGILKVVGNAELSFAAESVDLRGGSGKYPVANEVVSVDSRFTCEVKSHPDFLYEKWAGASVATTAASATGTVTAIANKSGTSVVSATVGIASVAAKSGSEADLKFGRYVVVAVTPTTVDVYVDTDLDFKSAGTQTSYVNDLLKVTDTPLTIPGTGGTVDLTGFGLTFTGGSGTVAMTAGDTAIFDVYPAHGGVSVITLGQQGIVFPEFGMLVYAQRRSDGSAFRINAFKAKSSAGIVIPLAEGGFSIPNLTTTLLYDPCQEKVAELTALAGTVTC